MGEDSLLERVTAAAEERQLSRNSLIAYRRTWLKIIAWAAAEGLVLETLPAERGVWGATEQKTGLTGIPIRALLHDNMLHDVA